MPELAPLTDRKVVVVGLGGLGAPSALEFARAGVGRLSLVDHDTADQAASVRWPLGVPAAGTAKIASIGAFVANHYPYVDISAHRSRIGAPRLHPGQDPEPDVLDRILDDAGLVYDATAEVGVHHLLSALAAERRIPYVYLYATPGGHGGLVARLRPWLGSGCWICLQHHVDTDGSIPAPPSDPDASVQPLGCADPTFTAAGFDMAALALAGVRLATATLCEDNPDGYPIASWDVQTMALRGPDGALALDTAVYTMSPHPACSACNG